MLSHRRGDESLVVENLTTIPQPATETDPVGRWVPGLARAGKFNNPRVLSTMSTSLQGVMVVSGYWQQPPFLNYVYYVCGQFFELLSARISDTRNSLSGKIRNLKSNFSSLKEAVGRRFTQVEERVRDLWADHDKLAETVSFQENELKKIKERLTKYEECLMQTKQE